MLTIAKMAGRLVLKKEFSNVQEDDTRAKMGFRSMVREMKRTERLLHVEILEASISLGWL